MQNKCFNKKVAVLELFSLKMYITSAKTYMIFVCLYALLSCLHTSMLSCVINHVQIVRTFKNRILIQLFKKWHNTSYHCITYIKSDTISRTSAWFLKRFKERFKENHIYDLVKQNSMVICHQVFFGKWKN